MQYEYDANGDLSSLVLMTFLLVLLVPLSYRTIWPKKAKRAASSTFPVKIDDDKLNQEVTRNRPQKSSINALYKSYFTSRYIILSIGWAVVAYLAYRVATTERVSKYWNPYEILGVDESATEKEIKKHYKRMSIKFHPDKVRLGVNQTLEQVQEQFVSLTKAYKALTDDEVRQNYLEHGNPDGKQDMSVGIALPTWMVEGGQSLWVLAAYCVTLLIGLPVVVGRWWYHSAKITKDGLLNLTAERYFRGIRDKMTTNELISLLCSAAELDSLPKSQASIDDLQSTIERSCATTFDPSVSSAELLLRAHMTRTRIDDIVLLNAQAAVLECIGTLHKGLYSVALSYGYLDTQMKILELSPAIVQATLPGDSPLLQLPYVSKQQVNTAEASSSELSIEGLLRLDSSAQRKILGLEGLHFTKALEVAMAIPVIDAAKVVYQVEGDDRITTNAIVQLVIKLRKAGGEPLKEKDLQIEDLDEDDVAGILNADEALAATAVQDSLSWAPYFPSPPKHQLWLSMADIKQDRVIVGPLPVEDIGEKVRTYKIPFQAPPTAGLYTFQVHIKSDTYLGMDTTFHMELDVADESASPKKEDDEISEPDEDTIAGQMAALKGGPVKLNNREYESSSEEELTDSSDDDSDSD
ncbi:putative Protein translocation complex componenet [Taphrina deformans PYCC 5710]|uniref:J domain-containing protein n=1 Tax=Taphrina deformans (strain PYCC 5710 / ATCC 11124 / CBS 356.35 / IMI 108563 / JCM 9778 / NBRC 8474) TaxID=1097556 RepID=R4X7V3_TAPDE|nr:putative Protein translocation complex componenet [Taphrina deformans PYCC 5710]|eukprot:CCG81531.1 putative Protein translocation complex componenet [Taphrina deformans PYCC 5710]